jgi:hypothetical protein
MEGKVIVDEWLARETLDGSRPSARCRSTGPGRGGRRRRVRPSGPGSNPGADGGRDGRKCPGGSSRWVRLVGERVRRKGEEDHPELLARTHPLVNGLPSAKLEELDPQIRDAPATPRLVLRAGDGSYLGAGAGPLVLGSVGSELAPEMLQPKFAGVRR